MSRSKYWGLVGMLGTAAIVVGVAVTCIAMNMSYQAGSILWFMVSGFSLFVLLLTLGVCALSKAKEEGRGDK